MALTGGMHDSTPIPASPPSANDSSPWSPNGAIAGYGPSASPFTTEDHVAPILASKTRCRCLQEADGARWTLDRMISSLDALSDDLDATYAASMRIAWQGEAATLFRESLTDLEAQASELKESAHDTRAMLDSEKLP